MRILAPAKVNLFLHITGRRPDGYHLLESLFVPIDWCDEVMLRSPAIAGEIARRGDLPWPAEADLGLRAAHALRQALAQAGLLHAENGVLPGAEIDIRKHLPHGAGLGGGSSDAAAVMRGLLKFWDVRAPRALFESVALSLGADVPFFLDARPSWVGGIGEVRQPVSLPRFGLLLLVPQVPVPTASVFQDPQLQRDHPPMPKPWPEALELRDLRDGSNAMQPVAARLYPEVQAALDVLQELAAEHASLGAAQCMPCDVLKVAMSGSGGACFAVFASPEAAEAAAAPARQMAQQRGLACTIRACEPLLSPAA